MKFLYEMEPRLLVDQDPVFQGGDELIEWPAEYYDELESYVTEPCLYSEDIGRFSLVFSQHYDTNSLIHNFDGEEQGFYLDEEGKLQTHMAFGLGMHGFFAV